MRTVFSNLLLAGATLAVSTSIAEISLRAAGATSVQYATASVPNRDTNWGMRDDEIGWINNPGMHQSIEFGNEPMTFWSAGRRATGPVDETSCAKGKIILAGDSWTQGYGVRDEHTYGWMLRASNPEYCFENIGTGGYGTLQSLMRIERSLAADPRPPVLVALGFTSYMAQRDTISYARLRGLRAMGNDVYFPPFVTRGSGGLQRIPPFRSLAWPMEDRSALLTLFHNGYYRARTSAYEFGEDRDAATTALIRETAQTVSRSGARFLFVWLQKDSLTIERYRAFLAGEGIESIDCEAAEGFTARLRVGGDGHPNRDYHRIFAACMQSRLNKFR